MIDRVTGSSFLFEKLSFQGRCSRPEMIQGFHASSFSASKSPKKQAIMHNCIFYCKFFMFTFFATPKLIYHIPVWHSIDFCDSILANRDGSFGFFPYFPQKKTDFLVRKVCLFHVFPKQSASISSDLLESFLPEIRQHCKPSLHWAAPLFS